MPATKRDYYDTLGVGREADDKTIKSAYRKMARQCHPDVNPNNPAAEERFKELSEAYSVLGNAEKRAAYDRFGPGFESFSGSPGFEQEMRSGTGPFADLGDLGDLFSMFLGGAGRRAPSRPVRQKGAALERAIRVDFRAAVFGETRSLQLEFDDPCARCSGRGQDYRACEACGGTGANRARSAGLLGIATPCGTCGGRGEVPVARCEECRGSGSVHRSRKVDVKIPPGVRTGSRIRLKGEGLAGAHGGPRGDLILVTEVADHPFFGRSEDDLTCEVPVTFPEAALGASVTVPTKDGRAKLAIPAGTQSSQVFRLRGMGIPHLHGGGTGDQLVTVRVAVPKHLSKRAKELVEGLSGEVTEDPRAAILDVQLNRGT